MWILSPSTLSVNKRTILTTCLIIIIVNNNNKNNWKCGKNNDNNKKNNSVSAITATSKEIQTARLQNPQLLKLYLSNSSENLYLTLLAQTPSPGNQKFLNSSFFLKIFKFLQQQKVVGITIATH